MGTVETIKDLIVAFNSGFKTLSEQIGSAATRLEVRLERFWLRLLSETQRVVFTTFGVIVGLALLLLGILIWLTRFFSTDYILMIAGLVVLYVVLMANLYRKRR